VSGERSREPARYARLDVSRAADRARPLTTDYSPLTRQNFRHPDACFQAHHPVMTTLLLRLIKRVKPNNPYTERFVDGMREDAGHTIACPFFPPPFATAIGGGRRWSSRIFLPRAARMGEVDRADISPRETEGAEGLARVNFKACPPRYRARAPSASLSAFAQHLPPFAVANGGGRN
jgi:hypothetical protein